jgi:hypothetical protein
VGASSVAREQPARHEGQPALLYWISLRRRTPCTARTTRPQVAAKMTEMLGMFPSELVHLESVQFSLQDVPQK